MRFIPILTDTVDKMISDALRNSSTLVFDVRNTSSIHYLAFSILPFVEVFWLWACPRRDF